VDGNGLASGPFRVRPVDLVMDRRVEEICVLDAQSAYGLVAGATAGVLGVAALTGRRLTLRT